MVDYRFGQFFAVAIIKNIRNANWIELVRHKVLVY